MLKDYLETLSDEQISRLATIYTGKNDIAFSKNKLITRLISFFSTTENLNQILSALSDKEKAIVNILYIKKEARLEDFVSLLALPLPVIQHNLFLLKLKLVVFKEEKVYSLNPDYNLKSIVNLEELFPSFKQSEDFKAVNRNVILAILNHFYSENIPTHQSHTEKYFRSDFLTSIFPGLSKAFITDLARHLFNVLINNDYLIIRGNHYTLEPQTLNLFIALNTPSLLSFFIFNTVSEATIKFLTFLPYLRANESSKACENIQKLALLVQLRKTPEIEALEHLNLVKVNNETLEAASKIDGDNPTNSTLSINSDLSIFFTGTLPQNSIIPLISTAEKIDTLSTYVINKENIAKAFDYFHSSKEIISRLSLSCENIPPLVINRIENWENMYNKISFYEGLVMVTSALEAKIIDSLPLIQIHIIKRLSDTVFLMNKTSEAQWRRILYYAGFELLGQVNKEETVETKEIKNLEFTTEKELKRVPSTLNLEKVKTTIETLPTNLKLCALQELKHNLLVNETQLTFLKELSQITVSGFDVKAKQNLLDKMSKEIGRSIKVILDEDEFEALVLDLHKVQKVYYTTLYNLETDTELTVPVSKIYSLSLLGF